MMTIGITQRSDARSRALAFRGGRSMSTAFTASWRVSSRMQANIG